MNDNTKHARPRRGQRKLDSQHNITLLAAATAVALSNAACGGLDQTDVAPDEPPTETVAASENTQKELRLDMWVVSVDEESAHVVGRSASAVEQVQLSIRRDLEQPEESVLIELAAPEAGRAWLDRDGTIRGATSSYLTQLASALYTDLGNLNPPTVEPAGDELGAASLALSEAFHGSFKLGWSMFGYAANLTLPLGRCQGVREGYSAYSDYGASCNVIDWTSRDPADCSIRLHYGIGGWKTDTCYWYVYRQ